MAGCQLLQLRKARPAGIVLAQVKPLLGGWLWWVRACVLPACLRSTVESEIEILLLLHARGRRSARSLVPSALFDWGGKLDVLVIYDNWPWIHWRAMESHNPIH